MSFKMVSSDCDDSRAISEDRPPLLFNVPEWSPEDVCRWIEQIEFSKYASQFVDNRVDGDLLLQMNDGQLKDEIGIVSKIERKRFMREMDKLKQSADYKCVDPTDLKSVLQSIGPELTVYTYPMLKAGVDSDSIRSMSENQLADECGVTNSIHRMKLLNSAFITISPPSGSMDSLNSSLMSDVKKVLDVFISYERCTRSAKLASLLKAHLEFKKYTVRVGSDSSTLDDYNDDTLFIIKQAKNFLLVLTDESLQKCIGDDECKNLMHKEIVCAIKHDCNIIPVTDNFTWPRAETLPADIQDLPGFNGVRWVHDYKYACMDKIEKFMLGSVRRTALELRSAPSTPLMSRSLAVVRNGNSFSVGERDSANGSNWLTVNPNDWSHMVPKTSDEISHHQMSKSLSDLFETTSELDLKKQEPTRTDIAAGSISNVSENVVEHEDNVSPVNISLRMPNILSIDKWLNKIKSFKS